VISKNIFKWLEYRSGGKFYAVPIGKVPGSAHARQYGKS
jgi:hypothetical protein